MFKDSDCTEYYDGSPQKDVYVRFNYGWVPGEETFWGGFDNPSQSLSIDTPEEGAESYGVLVYVDWFGEIGQTRPTAGQVVVASAPDETYEVTDPHNIFDSDGTSRIAT